MATTSKRGNRGAFWFFVLSSLGSFGILLALTVDTHRQVGALTHADKLTDEVVAGKRAFQKHNCNDCHTILGIGAYYAPDLTKAHWRLGTEALERTVLHPEVVYAKSIRKMPNLGVTKEEAAAIASYLEWTSNIDTNDWPPQDRKFAPSGVRRLERAGLSRGAALFKEKGCMGCHRLEGAGGTTGPALDGVGARLDEAAIEKWILDPASQKPDTQMPDLELAHDEAEALGLFLARQTAGTE